MNAYSWLCPSIFLLCVWWIIQQQDTSEAYTGECAYYGEKDFVPRESVGFTGD